MAKLKAYRAKRDFGKTPEPSGKASGNKASKASRSKGHRYVIQKHAATRLHYDLRLEHDGVMKSWAVTRGPSLVPGEKRLSIHVEDHPIEYNSFEGTIPKGEYGGGTVMIWDKGTWHPEFDADWGLKKGHLEFTLNGKKLKGRWHLVRLKPREGERQEPWLLIKSEDEYARTKSDPDILEEESRSAISGRTIEEIAAGKSKVWHSNRPASEQSTRVVSPKAKATMKAGGKVSTKKAPAKTSKGRAPRKAAASKKTSAKRTTAKKSTKKSKRRAAGSLAAELAAISRVRTARLPDFVPPCLATLNDTAPRAGDWMHEIKFDGYRMQARVENGTVTLKTRTGLDWTKRFPTVATACALFEDHDVLLDGEIVSGDADGVSNFSALQDDLKSGRHDRLAYYVFDLLHLDGQDLTGATLADRKRILKSLFSTLPDDGVIRLSENFDADGPTLLRHACEMKLEGILSKRSDAPYHSGRSGDWLKTKCSNSQEFVIAGFEPSDKRLRAIRSLLLGYYDEGELRYAGRVGTGWGEAKERDLSRRLAAVAADKPPFDTIPAEERGRGVKWVKPQLVAEIDFRGWTGGTLVRQASFKGLREDKPARQVVRETGAMPNKTRQAALRQKAPSKTTSTAKSATKSTAKSAARPKAKSAVAVAGVTLTHPDRIYWDDAGVTKQDLANYYEQVWKWIAPHVTGRVLALVRCPDGQAGQCFYQKHASAGIDQKHLENVPEPDGEQSIAIDELAGLVSLAQAGVLEVHVRGSTVEHLEEADRLVFDLDPGPGIEWQDIVAAARDVREQLKTLKLESFVKTTGGKGLHVVLPIRPTRWDEAKDFARSFAEAMAANQPQRYTASIKKAARGNRIFIDYLRNSREATAVAPYSTRARPGATVSAPLTWEELGKQKSPNFYTVESLPKRLAKLRKDPWAGIGKLKQKLPEIAKGKAR
jgi:bifunctional non-homologous end joining protein LigD